MSARASLFVLGIAAGCTGTPQVQVLLPNPLVKSGIAATQLCATLDIYSGPDLRYTFGPTPEAAGDGFTLSFSGVRPGNYRFVVLIADYPAMPCEDGGVGTPLLEFHDDNVTLSAGDANVFDGAARADLGAGWHLPAQASGDADVDADGLSNLDELLAGLDPYSPWTRVDVTPQASRGDILAFGGDDGRALVFITATGIYHLVDQTIVPITDNDLGTLTTVDRKGEVRWPRNCEPSSCSLAERFTSLRMVRDLVDQDRWHVTVGTGGGGDVLTDEGNVYYGSLSATSGRGTLVPFLVSSTTEWTERLKVVWGDALFYTRDTTFDFVGVAVPPSCVATSSCNGTPTGQPTLYTSIATGSGGVLTHEPAVVSLDLPAGSKVHLDALHVCGINAAAAAAGSPVGTLDPTLRIVEVCPGGNNRYEWSGTYASIPGADVVNASTAYRDGNSCYVVNATTHSGLAELVRTQVVIDPLTGCVTNPGGNSETNTILPTTQGTITALHVEGGAGALVVGDASGNLWRSEGIMYYYPTFDVWLPLPPLPDADPGPIVAVSSARDLDSGAVASLFVATPRAIYRMP